MRGVCWAAAVGLLLLAGPARGQGGGGQGGYRFARVTTIADGAVSLDAGSAEGIRQWTRVEIVRAGRAVAVLKVVTLGEHEVKCSITSRPVPVRVGDYARFLSSAAPAAPVAAGAPPVTRSARPPASPVAAPRPVVAAQPPTPAPTAVTPPPVTRPSPAPAPESTVVSNAPTPAPVQPAGTANAPVLQGPAARGARVTFVTTSTAYLGAGRTDGLAVGMRVDVVRHGRSVAELKVAFLSTHQAACQMVSVTDSVVVGDSVRFVPVPGGGVSSGAEAGARQVAQAPATRSSAGRLRGRIGLYYLTVVQRDSFGGQFSQPSGDIRLNGFGLGGSPLGVMVDLRSRRLVQALPGTPTNTVDQTRVYQAALSWQAPGSGFRFTTGRQYAPGISSVGLLDGAALEIGQSAWDYGVFAGMQPELVNLGFSSDISQLGGYVRRHNRQGALAHWSFTAGGTGSYLRGHTNREFLYLQANYFSRRFSLYAVQEVDYYRPWRRVNGQQAISPTSTFANLQFQATPGLSLTSGIDNRRNPLLYRDVVNPATVFDDAFRRGVWAGVAVRSPRHFRASLDARTNHDATTGSTNTYTLALGAEGLTSLGASVRTRSTRYTAGSRNGWLNSVSLGLEPWGRGSVALTSGWRSERDSAAVTTLDIRWLSADLDVSLARSVFVILSAYRETGGLEAHDLLYAGLSYRF